MASSARKAMETQRLGVGHELLIAHDGAVLLVDHQPRGGLLVQVGTRGIHREPGYSFTSIRIPKRFVIQLRAFLDVPRG